MFIDVIIMPFAVFVDAPEKPVFVALQAVFFVHGLNLGAYQQTYKQSGTTYRSFPQNVC